MTAINVSTAVYSHLLRYLSFYHGTVPSFMKSAYITPRLKKADLDPTDAKSYRPISNLSVLSKLLERLVCEQLVSDLSEGQRPSS